MLHAFLPWFSLFLSQRVLPALLHWASPPGPERAFDDLVPQLKFPGSASPAPVLALPSLKVLRGESAARSHLELALMVTSRAPDTGRPEEAAQREWIQVPTIPGLHRHTVSGRYYGMKKTHGRRKEHSLGTHNAHFGGLLHRDSLAVNEGPLFPSRLYAHKIGHSNCVILRESGEGLISCSIYNTQFTTYLRQNCAMTRIVQSGFESR